MALTAALFFYASRKEASFNTHIEIPAGIIKFWVFLTDGPYDFQQVLVNIQRFEIKLDTCHRSGNDNHEQPGSDDDHDTMNHYCDVWDTLDIHPGYMTR